jgi:hypothetical protein
MEEKQLIGTINIITELNTYAIKCLIYNKLTKMRLATYKNLWELNEFNIYILNLNCFTLELHNNTLKLYSNAQISYSSNEYKQLSYILHELA